MDKPKLLSGHELVARGITKTDASLPEIGIKDVVPNGSWLEQKQIQSALEARKHMIEVERIEKSGVLSHAKWREELMLAEVTRNVGGHWQYFGHHVGKQLFLNPEEALFLIEVNCLRLTYNDVTVSMQQAYSLLLRSKISLLQYKVYASLSRIGYKVYRHDSQKVSEHGKKNDNAVKLKTRLNTSNFIETTEERRKDCEDNTNNEIEVVDDADENLHHQYHKECETKTVEKDCEDNTHNRIEIVDDADRNANHQNHKEIKTKTTEKESKDYEDNTYNEMEVVDDADGNANSKTHKDCDIKTTGKESKDCEDNTHNEMEVVDDADGNENSKNHKERDIKTTGKESKGCEDNTQNDMEVVDDADGNENSKNHKECDIKATEKESKDCKDNTHNEMEVVDDTDGNANHQNYKESETKSTEKESKDCEEDMTNKMKITEDTTISACNQGTNKCENVHNCAEKRKEVVFDSNKKANDSATMDVDENITKMQDCVETNSTKCLNITRNMNAATAKDDDTEVEVNEGEEDNMITGTDSGCVSSTECERNAQLIPNSVNESKETNTETRSENVDSIDESTNEITSTNDLGTNCEDHNSKLSVETIQHPEMYHQYRIKKLENRKVRAFDWKNTEKCFEKIPDVSEKQIVLVNVPEEEYIPRKVFLNNISYLLNLDTIKNNTKSTRPRSSESRYSANEEVNGDHIKRIKDTPSGNTPVTNLPPLFPNNRFNRPLYQNLWRPNINCFPYNFIFRSFLPNSFLPRFRVFSPRPPLLGMYPRFNSFQPNEQRNVPNVSKSRRNSAKQKETHLEAIKSLAMRLKHLVQSGNRQQENIDSLQRLINTFNAKYNMRLRLTNNFDVFNDETIVETITLDEDEEPSSKRAKIDDDDDKYKENFNKLKQLALKLKGLGHKGEVNSRHRRAFSSLIKKFNKSYGADVYFNSNFEVIDRRFVNLDSSSDSDCVIENTANSASSKKLKNPFNILKRLSEKQITTSSNSKNDGTILEETKTGNYRTTTKNTFDKKWLPSEDDFGRAEILPKSLMNSYLIESKREEFLYEFIKSQPYEFDSWLDIKLSFLKSFEDTNIIFENDIAEVTPIKSLIEPNDCTDMPSVLKKLSIIRNNKEIDTNASLNIDFDVYNRDVQNFRKSNRPKPHFRIICVSKASGFPNGKDVASLHSKYDDNVTIVFAVVGVGSISYLQINPIDLPVYIPSNDFP